MANMTRADMVTELQSRGHSRFASTSLERYLDWALQTVYGKAKFPRAALSIHNSPSFTGHSISFATISGGSSELVSQVQAVFVKYGTHTMPVDAASDVEFREVIWPNTQETNPVTGAYPVKYYVYDDAVWVYPSPLQAVSIFVHYLAREDVFSGPGDVTALPERFDKVVISQAEVYCYRRAHNFEDMAVAMNEVDGFILEELGMEGSVWEEDTDRVVPYGY